MSEVFDKAVVRILLADYSSADTAGKINIIGGGLSVVGQPTPTGAVTSTGFTSPFAVVIVVTVPPDLYSTEAALEVVLEDAKGDPVPLPGPAGEPQLLRVAQNYSFEEPLFAGVAVPRKTMPARVQWVLNFGSGLPLSVNQLYVWRVKIDGDSRDEWTEPFFVPGAAPGPVFG